MEQNVECADLTVNLLTSAIAARPPNGAADKPRAEASVGFIRWMGGRERSAA